MKRRSTLILFVLVPALGAASTLTPRAAVDLYHRRLAATCPDKRLDLLSPAALSDLDDDFLPHFSRSQRRLVQSSIDRNCRGIDMGATCGNVGFLRATIRLHKLQAFTTHVCRTPQRCTGQSTCTDTR